MSWKFYVQGYNPSADLPSASPANPETQTARVPLVDYPRFTQDPALARHIVGLDQYYQGPAGRDVARRRVHRQLVRRQRAIRAVDRRRAEPGPHPGHPAHGEPLLGQFGAHVVLRRLRRLVRPRAPPRVGRAATLGFRVPALLVSAYARKGQVNHTVLDYTSALKFIEQNWRLAPLTARDAHANSLASAFDFAAGPRPPVLIPSGRSALPAGTVPDACLPPPTPVTAIYLLYGGAAVIGVVLLLFAAWWPALRRGAGAGRRPAYPAGRGELVRGRARSCRGHGSGRLPGQPRLRPVRPGRRRGPPRRPAQPHSSRGRSPSRSAPSRAARHPVLV